MQRIAYHSKCLPIFGNQFYLPLSQIWRTLCFTVNNVFTWTLISDINYKILRLFMATIIIKYCIYFRVVFTSEFCLVFIEKKRDWFSPI